MSEPDNETLMRANWRVAYDRVANVLYDQPETCECAKVLAEYLMKRGRTLDTAADVAAVFMADRGGWQGIERQAFIQNVLYVVQTHLWGFES